jgi:hypothetical protein
VSHRRPSSLPSLRDYFRFGRRRPSQLTLRVAAVTAAAIAGPAIGLTISATPSGGAAGNTAAIGHPAAVPVPSHAAVPTKPPRQATPVRHAAVPAKPPRQATPVRHAAVPAKPAVPWRFYDSVIPSAIPANGIVATYATGPYAVSPAQVAGRTVIWIDVSGMDYNASALDVEPGDATPSMAASWAWHRLTDYPNAIAHIYTSLSEWPAVQAACATLPARTRSRIRWWIADPNGVPHIVPGSDATQWYWGQTYDISTATPNF